MDEPAVRAQLAEADITLAPVHRALPAPELVARSLARGEGAFAANGALVVTTGERTGRVTPEVAAAGPRLVYGWSSEVTQTP